MGIPIGTPSVRAGLTGDVYLTIAGNRPPEVGASEVHLEVFLKPLIIWLWIGGLMMAVGTLFAAFPVPAAGGRSIRCRLRCPRLRTRRSPLADPIENTA